MRIAFIVSHPIQYYAPLHQRLAQRDALQVKVFFTWHDAAQPVFDAGFGQDVQWDVPLTSGYEHSLVRNVSRKPGTTSFSGLRNPSLVDEVHAWRPDVVHVTGWAWWSHLDAMRRLAADGVPVVFRGDSHLLDGTGPAWRWHLKRGVLRHVFSWPRRFLFTGQANRDYYRAFGVPDSKLAACPHGIDTTRFSQPHGRWEEEARRWRAELGFAPHERVVLFAGKFEPKKRPLEMMRAVLANSSHSILLVGGGALDSEVRALAATRADRCRVLPFQNQSRMPVVYRLGDVFVLPSSFGETWGLAVTEALACARPVVVSDRVGCAVDVVERPSGIVFPWRDLSAMITAIGELAGPHADVEALRDHASRRAALFDITRTEQTLLHALQDFDGHL